jgi:hypothetical protein
MKKNQQERILARKLAREISKEELRQVAGGMPARGLGFGGAGSSTSWSSSGSGEGDDGGADD